MQPADVRKVNGNDVIGILLKKYGLLGTARVVWTDVLYDWRHSVDTFRPVANTELFDSERAERQNRYVPSTFGLIEATIDRIAPHVAIERSNFVDFGSGKGKVLIGAARRPFQRIKGIEFSERLHRIAQQNIRTLALENRVELIQGDASQFVPDDSDRVLYFFNPFVGDLLEDCLRNIAQASQQVPRYLIYANPVEDQRFCRYFDKLEEATIQPGGIRVNFFKTRQTDGR